MLYRGHWERYIAYFLKYYILEEFYQLQLDKHLLPFVRMFTMHKRTYLKFAFLCTNTYHNVINTSVKCICLFKKYLYICTYFSMSEEKEDNLQDLFLYFYHVDPQGRTPQQGLQTAEPCPWLPFTRGMNCSIILEKCILCNSSINYNMKNIVCVCYVHVKNSCECI